MDSHEARNALMLEIEAEAMKLAATIREWQQADSKDLCPGKPSGIFHTGKIEAYRQCVQEVEALVRRCRAICFEHNLHDILAAHMLKPTNGEPS